MTQVSKARVFCTKCVRDWMTNVVIPQCSKCGSKLWVTWVADDEDLKRLRRANEGQSE